MKNDLPQNQTEDDEPFSSISKLNIFLTTFTHKCEQHGMEFVWACLLHECLKKPLSESCRVIDDLRIGCTVVIELLACFFICYLIYSVTDSSSTRSVMAHHQRYARKWLVLVKAKGFRHRSSGQLT